MADESLPGINIPITADFSDLGPEMDQAAAEAKTKADQIASAITEALNDIKTDGVVSALMKLGEAAGVGAEGVDQLANRMQELLDTGAATTQAEALTQALQEMGTAAQGAVSALGGVADAEREAGEAAAEAAGGQKQFSDGAQSLVDKQSALDAALQQAIAVLAEVHDAYTQGAASADVLAQAEKNVDDALKAASPSLESVKSNLKDVSQETETAADRFAKFGEAMAAAAGALAFTEGLKSLGMAALEAADAVDDSTKALALLGGGAEKAEASVSQLRQIASEDALSFPNLLVASQRMTAFLGSSEKVPEIMRAAADAAQVMGVGVESAAKSIERFAAGGDISAKSLKALGLTMGDMATVLGTTEDNAKKAFAALDQAGKIDAVTSALGKFKGAAKDASDDALGSLVRLGQSWSQVLEEIGKALDPVIKALADFAKSNIVEPIRNLVAAFNGLPAPVKDFAVVIGIAAAALVPIAAGIAGVALALPMLSKAFADLQIQLGEMAVESGIAEIAFAEILIPIAAVAAAIALLEFTGLGDDIMAFLQGPLATLKDAFSTAADIIKQDFSDLGGTLKEFWDSASGLFQDLGPLIKDTIELSWKPLVEIIKQLGETFGLVTPEAITFKDVIHTALELTAPIAALEVLNRGLKDLKSAIDAVRPAIQLLSGDTGTLKQATKDATDAMRLQQDMAGQNARLFADQAMGLNKVADATNAYSSGLKTLQEHQQKLNDAVTQTKGVLDAAREAYDGSAKAQQVINAAMVDYEKAVKAANAETKAAKDAHKDLAEQLKVSAAAVDAFDQKVAAGGSVSKLQAAFESASKSIDMLAKQDLPAAIKAVDDYTAAQERNGAKASVIMEAFAKESELIKKLANEDLPAASAAELKLIDTLSQGATPLGVWQKALADEEGILQKLAKEDLAAAESGWQKLIAALEKAQAPASVISQALQDHTKFLDSTAKAADAAEAAFVKLDLQFTKIAEHLPTANEAISKMEGFLNLLGPDMDLVVQKADPLNQAMIDFGVNAGKAKTAAENLKTPIDQLTTSLGLLIDKAQASGDWTPVLAALDTFDKRIQTIAKTDLPEAVKEMEAWIGELQKHGAPAELVQGQLDKLGPMLEKMAKENLPGAAEAWANYLAMLDKVGPASGMIVEDLQRQIDKQIALVAQLKATGAAYGDILAAEGSAAQGAVDYAKKTGEANDAAVGGLKKVELEQRALALNTVDLMTAYTQMIDDVLKGFDQMAGAMASAIVNGQNLGAALVKVFQGIAQSIIKDLIQDALAPLEKDLVKLISGTLPSFTGQLVASSTATTALGTASTTTAAAQVAMTATTTTATGAVTALGIASSLAAIQVNTLIGAIAGIIGAIAGIVGDVYLAAIDKKMFNVQTSLLAIQNDTANARADAWSQFGQMYERLGEVKNDADSMKDSLLQLAAAGAGGGIGAAAQADLDSIAADVHVLAQYWNTMLGSLSTIAQDIVTYGGYIMSDLDVMVQKLGGILTYEMSGNDLLAHAATTESVDEAANTISDSVDGAAAETGNAIASAASRSVSATAQQLSANAVTVTTAINHAATTEPSWVKQQIDISRAAAAAATNTDSQITALRNEEAGYEALMQQAIDSGNFALAETYRQQALNVQRDILQVQGAVQDVPSMINQQIVASTGTLGFQVTAAGTLVATAVGKAAVDIAAAVSAVGFGGPTKQGTTINIPPAGTQGGPVTSGSNPSIPVGTQPGFGGGSTKNETNSPANIPTTVVASSGMTYDPNLPDPTKAKAPYVPPLDTTSTYSNYYKPPDVAIPAPTGGPTLPGAGAGASTPTTTAAPPAPATDPAVAAALAQLATDQAALREALKNFGNSSDDQERAQLQKQANDLLKAIADDQAKIAAAQSSIKTGGTEPAPGSSAGLPTLKGGPVLASESGSLPTLKGGPTLPGGPKDDSNPLSVDALIKQAADAVKSLSQQVMDAAAAGNTALRATLQQRLDLMADRLDKLQHQDATAQMKQTEPQSPTSSEYLIQQAKDSIEALKKQLADAKRAGDKDLISTLEQRLDLMTDRLAKLQPVTTGGAEPAPGKTGGSVPSSPTATKAPTTSASGSGTLVYTNPSNPLAVVMAGSPAAATTSTTGLPTLKGGPTLPAPAKEPENPISENSLIKQAEDSIKSLTQQIADATTAGNKDLVDTLKQRLDLMTDRLGKLQQQGANTPASSAMQQTESPSMFSNAGVIADTKRMIESLISQIADAKKAGDSGLVTTLQGRLDVMNDRLAKLQPVATGGAEPAPTKTGGAEPAPTNTTGIGSLPQQLDSQTAGFYAGALAELEDIRVQSHRIGDLTSSFRDGLVAIGTQLLSMTAKPGEHPKVSFDEGGPVPMDMVAQLHGGEEVLPKDVAQTLRSMMRTPNYGSVRSPSYDDSSRGGKIVNVNMPVTVISRGDPREQAKQLTQHIKAMVADAGAYTS